MKGVFKLSLYAVLLSLGACVVLFLATTIPNETHPAIQEVTVAEQDNVVLPYWDNYMAAVVAVKDTAFTNFVLFDLQEKCPFYKPDGTSYRDCLNRLIDKEIGGFKGGSAAVEKIKNDCDKESAQYIGDLTNTALSLDLSCQAYKFSGNKIF